MPELKKEAALPALIGGAALMAGVGYGVDRGLHALFDKDQAPAGRPQPPASPAAAPRKPLGPTLMSPGHMPTPSPPFLNPHGMKTAGLAGSLFRGGASLLGKGVGLLGKGVAKAAPKLPGAAAGLETSTGAAKAVEGVAGGLSRAGGAMQRPAQRFAANQAAHAKELAELASTHKLLPEQASALHTAYGGFEGAHNAITQHGVTGALSNAVHTGTLNAKPPSVLRDNLPMLGFIGMDMAAPVIGNVVAHRQNMENQGGMEQQASWGHPFIDDLVKAAAGPF